MSGYIDGHIMTYTGKLVDPQNLYERDICIEDIAHALSQIGRFCGHTREFYSVGQYSIIVSCGVQVEISKSKDIKLTNIELNTILLAALLHDATEAYIHDISGPLKDTEIFAKYKIMEKRVEYTIDNVFDIIVPDDIHQLIKKHDTRALRTEQRDLMAWSHDHSDDWYLGSIRLKNPDVVEKEFLERFYRLNARRFNNLPPPSLSPQEITLLA